MDGLALMVNPSRGELLRRVADDIFRHYGAARPSAFTHGLNATAARSTHACR